MPLKWQHYQKIRWGRKHLKCVVVGKNFRPLRLRESGHISAFGQGNENGEGEREIFFMGSREGVERDEVDKGAGKEGIFEKAQTTIFSDLEIDLGRRSERGK